FRANLDEARDPGHYRGMLRLQFHFDFRISLASFPGSFFRRLREFPAELGVGILWRILLASRRLALPVSLGRLFRLSGGGRTGSPVFLRGNRAGRETNPEEAQSQAARLHPFHG